MDRKIGVIVPDIELKSRFLELFKEDVEKGNIIIDILDADNMDEQGRILESRGAKAIIARSGSFRHISGTVKVPIVHLKVTTPDILQALKAAKGYGKEIVLVISDLDYFDYDEWKDLINADIVLERFHSRDEIHGRVENYIGKKDEVVIVGGGIPCNLAKNWGMDSVFINASKESIHESVTTAWELIDSLYEQKYNNEALKTILNQVHDAVIAVNRDKDIRLYNERARELLKKDSVEVLGKKLQEAFPELDFMLEVLESQIDQNNEIKVLKNITIAANSSLFWVDGHIEGVVCSFQDITKLQSLEKKIRLELNKKGHVAKYTFDDMIANGPIMKGVVEKAKKIGLSDNTVMIYGESGTGKEMIAQSIHNIGSRKDAPFVAINCAAISENLLESELFGYEEGAFTGARKGGKPGLFELAHGGTIFLDEINSISSNLQAKLLRVLEERETMRIGSDYVIPLDVRVVAATNEELKTMVKEGRFRKDLFYRLSILELYIPPLRERPLDIVPLFNHYLNRLSGNSRDLKIDDSIGQRLLNYTWPGNARELRNIVQRYVLFNELDLQEDRIISKPSPINGEISIDLKEINRFVEERVIDMLSSQGLNKTEIAKMLGISRTALWKKSRS